MTNISEERPVLSGRYELHRRIARGGMAEVFLARDQLLDRPVAVKVLFPQYAADPTFVARFRREAQAAANLNHPSIVAVYDWGHQDETYFIVMEYVEGQSLAELLVEEGPLDVGRATEIVADVASALGFAHRNGTVHRDVKPGNIMITNDDKVKVADFGIARAFGGADDQLTQVGSVMGTASYFSPEQAQGKQVDPRSDIYSLGVVLFEMVTGQTPFSGESPVAIAYKHVQETPPRPSLMNPAIKPELEAVIARMLAKNPEQRYSTAEDLRSDLHRYQQGQPLTYASQSNGAAPAGVMNGDATRVEPVSRAVIDTARAVPASVASGRIDPVEEYYEQPSRTGVFLVALLGLLVVLVGVVVWIISSLGGADDSELVDAEVPNVIEMTQDEAIETITDADFLVEIELGESDLDSGLVFDQDPLGGIALEEGGTITIFVSQGSETETVPDVVGDSEERAVAQLEALGFDVDVQTERSDSVDAGDVISVEPGPGETANKGSTIVLLVSEGGQTVQIPNVQGSDQIAASNELSELGFRVQIVREASSNVPEGQAIRTDPAANQSVEEGSRVQLFVSSGSAQAVVPPVVGMTEALARAALNSAGFSEIVVVEQAAPEGQEGLVLAQSVQGGTNADTGSPITLTVGRSVNASTTTTIAATTTTIPAEDP